MNPPIRDRGPLGNASAFFILGLLCSSSVAPISWLSPSAHAGTRVDGIVYTDDEGPRLAYVYVRGGEDWVSGSGDMRDYDRAKELRDRYEGDFLLVRRGARSYVVRDPDILERVRDMFEPMERTGREQGEVGSKQAAIGEEQAKLGVKQARLGAKQGELGARQGELAARTASAAAEGRSTRRADREEMQAIQDEMEELGRQQAELGRQQAALARKQEPFAREQARLGKIQAGHQRKVLNFMEEAIPDWIRNGEAEPID